MEISNLKYDVLIPYGVPHTHKVPSGYNLSLHFANQCGNFMQQFFIYNNNLVVVFESNLSTLETHCKSNVEISLTDVIEIGQ